MVGGLNVSISLLHAVSENLKNAYLDFLPQTCFSVYSIHAYAFLINVEILADFMISFNPGEPLRSLHKVASGGEMSRIMLAFKSYFAKTSKLSLMVFDEIDTGVSGATAKKIALKMKAIAKYNQVLCITHLPQVASIGDSHIHIYKEIANERTTTHYKYLSFDERVEEVALMLSGDKMSLYAIEAAKAMIQEA